MRQRHQIELERLGLSAVEAQIYLALLKKGGTWRATAIAATMQIPRSTVYLALNSLQDRGLLEAEPGYGGRFSAVPPDRALPSLIAAEREELSQREKELGERETVAEQLTDELKSTARTEAATDIGTEMIQVLRDPRSVLERFKRLQLDAEKTVDAFTKAPYFDPGGNQPESEALRRGVRVRAIYEKAGVDNPGIKPFFHKWITAGEEARIYDGELPHKMVIFDQKIVLMPLFTPGEQMRGVLIRNAQLAECLSLAFQFIWDKAEPLVLGPAKPDETIVASQQTSSWPARRNGHARLRRKKSPND